MDDELEVKQGRNAGMPKSKDIAAFWAEKEDSPFEVNFDSPSCFACGVDGGSLKWSGFERAHLVPYSITANNEMSNIVLLCKNCHHEAPDCVDPSYMIDFIVNKEPYFCTIFRAVNRAIAEVGFFENDKELDIDLLEQCFFEAREKVKDDFAVHHSGRRTSEAKLHSFAHRTLNVAKDNYETKRAYSQRNLTDS